LIKFIEFKTEQMSAEDQELVGVSSEEKVKSKKRSKKKKRKSVDHDQCYICHDQISKKEMYYPCNCEFGFVHRSCLKRWVRKHPKCRICGLKYHLDRRNDTCFLCKKDASDQDELIKPCDCRHVTVHNDCLNQAYQNDYLRRCEYCNYRYQVKEESTIEFNHQKSFHYWRLTGFFFLNLLTIFVSVILMAGTNLTSFNRPFVTDHDPEKMDSFLLFPGEINGNLAIIDMFYTPAFAIGGVGTFVTLVAWIICVELERFEVGGYHNHTKGKLGIFTGRLVWFGLILLLQLMGNIHYQFYYWVGVIPEINHFWMFNGYSFSVGLAGLILVTSPVTVPLAIGYTSYHLFKCCCLQEKTSVQVVPKEMV